MVLVLIEDRYSMHFDAFYLEIVGLCRFKHFYGGMFSAFSPLSLPHTHIFLSSTPSLLNFLVMGCLCYQHNQSMHCCFFFFELSPVDSRVFQGCKHHLPILFSIFTLSLQQGPMGLSITSFQKASGHCRMECKGRHLQMNEHLYQCITCCLGRSQSGVQPGICISRKGGRRVW